MANGYLTLAIKPDVHVGLRDEAKRLGIRISELCGVQVLTWDDLTEDEKWKRIREYRERSHQQSLAAAS